jgi:hypothetical protein
MPDHASPQPAYKTPEGKRAYRREWYRRNREKVLARQRETRERDKEKTRQQQRAYRERNRARINLRARERYRRDPQTKQISNQAWAQANKDRIREYKRGRRLAGIKDGQERQRDEIAANLWHEQDGRCYLCADPVMPENAHVEHDHRCCPKGSFCRYCVRGLSCPACNYVVGHAYDSPDRLELIAQNLRAKLAEVNERLAVRARQLDLLEGFEDRGAC